MKLPRRIFLVLLGLTLLAGLTPLAWACPFCTEGGGKTLIQEFQSFPVMIVGSLRNAKLKQDQTELVVETVFKGEEFLKGEKTILLPRYLPEQNAKVLLIAEIFEGKIDPFRYVPIPEGSDLVKYLRGALAVEKKPATERLRYYFDYLNNPNIDISLDAYREFYIAPYAEYKQMATQLDPNVIAGWLKDPNTAPYRYGLYGSLLGHCGTAEHATLLRSMIDDPEKNRVSGCDGLMAAYVMIQPKEAWDYLATILRNPNRDFFLRYAVLRTARFLYEQRPDLVSQKDLLTGYVQLIDQPDMADFAVEDLRKWHKWEYTDTILGVFGKKSHDSELLKRAILRFALSSPEPKAKTFVEQQKQRDNRWVQDVQALLEIEDAAATAVSTPAPAPANVAPANTGSAKGPVSTKGGPR